MKILMIDDDPGMVNLTSAVLKLRGHSVVGLTDSRKVLVELSAQSFDLIISDVYMPGLSGFDLQDQIEKRLGAKAPPILFITGNEESVKQIQATPRDGVLGVLHKPFEMDELKTAISEAEVYIEQRSRTRL